MIKLSGQNGGGQILRSALTLSMITGQPFRMNQIRGKRPKPGLMRQHLTCVKAAVQICQGSVEGAEIGSTEITFQPGKVAAGDYHFAIGSAGSTTLLAQTLLPAMWGADGDSTLLLEGGTHNPLAPTMDFICRAYLPMLQKMGITICAELHRYGFAPAGGGKVEFEIPGNQTLKPVELTERGGEISRRIHCLAAFLPEHVSDKETNTLNKRLQWPEACIHEEITTAADCGGNVLTAEVLFENTIEHSCAFGAYGKISEQVAKETGKIMHDYLSSGAVVGHRLADQLILPMALSGKGKMLTMHPSNHLLTNVEVIQKFLEIAISITAVEQGRHLVELY